MTVQDSSTELSQLSQTLELPVHESLESLPVAADFVKAINIGFARSKQIVGLGEDNSELQVAICSLDGWKQLDTIARILDRRPRVILAPADAIQTAINRAYSDRESQTKELLTSISSEELLDEALTSKAEDLLDNGGRAPIIRLVSQLLFEAVKAGASDVHVQPAEDHVLIRQRIDGVLFDTQQFPKAIQDEVLTRIKVMGEMNIAEKRLPQDGRATVQLGDRIVDLRIASLPTSHSERIVIRLLDKSARLYTLEELGMEQETLQRWRELIQLDHGLILVTGPTGSGKSTTLYSALQEVNSKEMNVLTLEDPIEYQLDGISQSQINEKKGLTFAAGMRSVLRQDPDIIMVGEIRDRDTATMAIQASLTGHLVFSTLHTNDAASAVTRLLDLGVEPYLVASSMVASLAQRLVRKLCPQCKRELSSTQAEASSRVDRFEPVGCSACRDTGFAGRLGLFELLVVDDACRDLIQNRSNAAAIREYAMQHGMSLLARDGVRKAKAGVTTVAEVLRATSFDAEAD
ncbi:MAG: ATPase, T2SS/T4P/T4SS family [Planctomycetota bacterium]